MKRMLINATQPEEIRVALIDGYSLYDLYIERTGFEQYKGNIYKAVITSIEPSLDAVFVDYGGNRHGFLPVKEIAAEYLKDAETDQSGKVNLKQALKLGQELLIQVEKEERGSKGAALTTYISLAGSFLVLMPNNPRAGGISRRVEGDHREELRDHLSRLNVSEGMGIIVRTAGVGRNFEELQWDLDILLRHWQSMQEVANAMNAPRLIHKESDSVTRALRDYLRSDIAEILIDDKAIYEHAKEYLQRVRPDFIDHLIYYENKIPLFTCYQVENQIETAYQREVKLPSGGSIVIDHTEALISIDINSSRSTKGSDIEETAFNTNLEAANEIAKQLRLRDLGGLIVIDFIDMSPIRHQREVENQLRNAVQLDRSRIQIGRISRFGLLEMSRQRLRPSLGEATQIICPRCTGKGSIRGVETMSLTIIRMLEEDAMKTATLGLQAQLPIDIATYLLNEKRKELENIEKRHQVFVTLIPNPNLQSPQYRIERITKTDETGTTAQSYQMIEEQVMASEVDESEKRPGNEVPAFKPVVTGDKPKSKETVSLIKRIWTGMFSNHEPVAPAKKPQEKAAEPRRNSSQKNTGTAKHSAPTRGRRQDSGTNPSRNSKNTSNTSRSKSTSRSGGGRQQSAQSAEHKPRRSTHQSQNRAKPVADAPPTVKPKDENVLVVNPSVEEKPVERKRPNKSRYGSSAASNNEVLNIEIGSNKSASPMPNLIENFEVAAPSFEINQQAQQKPLLIRTDLDIGNEDNTNKEKS